MLEEDEDFLLTDEDIRAAVRHWLDSGYWQPILKRNVDGLTPYELRRTEAKLPDILLNITREEGERLEHNLARHAESALSHAEYGVPDDVVAIRKAGDEMLRQLREYVDRRMQTVFGLEAGPAISDLPTTTVAQPPANMAKLSTFIQPWQKAIAAGYNHGKALSHETTDQYLKTVGLFLGLMGDLPVGRVNFEQAAQFREFVLQMPATHGKGAIGSPKKELARARADKTMPLVSMKTAKRHFSGMRSLWKWLVFKKHVPAGPSPFDGHSFPNTRSKKSARDAWSSENLLRLFASPAYREAPQSSALHWLPLIALHSGMRLEEICRLRPGTDIVVKNGIHCFDIQARDGWDPKTESGTRFVPVHRWLIGHGLIEFAKRQRAAGAEHLFSPELTLHKHKLSSGFSREFSRIKSSLGVGDKTTFHSFRHTFRTVLDSTDFKDAHIDAVMGHESGTSEGRTYVKVKGVTIEKLRDVVDSFVPPLDLSFLGKASDMSPPPLPKVPLKKRKLTPPVLDAAGRLVRPRKK